MDLIVERIGETYIFENENIIKIKKSTCSWMETLLIYMKAIIFIQILHISLSLLLFFVLSTLTHCSLHGVNLMPDSASKASTPPFFIFLP